MVHAATTLTTSTALSTTATSRSIRRAADFSRELEHSAAERQANGKRLRPGISPILRSQVDDPHSEHP